MSAKDTDKSAILKQCQALFPQWAKLSIDDFHLDDPKGFSSFTMGIRCKTGAEPPAILYRRLDGKENAILDFVTEKNVFLELGAKAIAAQCYHYDETARMEAFYEGRTLEAEDLFDPGNLQKIANELFRLHQLDPPGLPQEGFFELLHAKWGKIAKSVLEDKIDLFPSQERELCVEMREIYSPTTAAKVRRCIPDGPLTFCHNDTYHGNIMKLDDGGIKLLDFEFSCKNNKAYDFSNLFAETVMRHKLPDYPFFRIAEPEFDDTDLGTLINFYLDNARFETTEARDAEHGKLLSNTKDMLILSDYKYAMAALPLAVEPIQKIRFIPYAHQRFSKFLRACEERFGN